MEKLHLIALTVDGDKIVAKASGQQMTVPTKALNERRPQDDLVARLVGKWPELSS